MAVYSRSEVCSLEIRPAKCQLIARMCLQGSSRDALTYYCILMGYMSISVMSTHMNRSRITPFLHHDGGDLEDYFSRGTILLEACVWRIVCLLEVWFALYFGLAQWINHDLYTRWRVQSIGVRFDVPIGYVHRHFAPSTKLAALTMI